MVQFLKGVFASCVLDLALAISPEHAVASTVGQHHKKMVAAPHELKTLQASPDKTGGPEVRTSQQSEEDFAEWTMTGTGDTDTGTDGGEGVDESKCKEVYGDGSLLVVDLRGECKAELVNFVLSLDFAVATGNTGKAGVDATGVREVSTVFKQHFEQPDYIFKQGDRIWVLASTEENFKAFKELFAEENKKYVTSIGKLGDAAEIRTAIYGSAATDQEVLPLDDYGICDRTLKAGFALGYGSDNCSGAQSQMVGLVFGIVAAWLFM